MTETVAKTKIYTTQFWLLCLSSLFFFASFNMLLPELPAYLTSLGGAKQKGLIISLFTLTAMISRPFSGKLADTVGRIPVIFFGAAVCFICSLLYPVLTTVAGFLWLRLVHGFSTGFSPTGISAYISDIIPASRRGEGMGLIGTAGTIGMAAGPAVGGAIANVFGLTVMFYCSSLFAVTSIVILLRIKETRLERKPMALSILKVNRNDLFDFHVVVPAVAMALAYFAYGAVYTVLPDFGQFLGISNKGLLFTFMTVSSLIIRLLAGKASDRFGRQPVMMITVMGIAGSMLVIGFASTPLMLIIGVSLYGLAQGSTSPTILAWATDLSSEDHRGRAIASVYISMEFGIGIGAFISGLIYDNNSTNFLPVFVISAVVSAAAFLFLLIRKIISRP
jgi:MFS family permease